MKRLVTAIARLACVGASRTSTLDARAVCTPGKLSEYSRYHQLDAATGRAEERA